MSIHWLEFPAGHTTMWVECEAIVWDGHKLISAAELRRVEMLIATKLLQEQLTSGIRIHLRECTGMEDKEFIAKMVEAVFPPPTNNKTKEN